jgi:hypothetical protein
MPSIRLPALSASRSSFSRGNDLIQSQSTGMQLSRPVPAEIWQRIAFHLVHDRDTLKAIVHADCAASHEAERMYWRNDLSKPGLIEELEDQPVDKQQALAMFVRRVTLSFTPSRRRENKNLTFPQLRILAVVHDSVRYGHCSRVHAHIARFLGPRLRELSIGIQAQHEHCTSEPNSENFLQTLQACVELRSLKLRVYVLGGTANDLALALTSCSRLFVLYLSIFTSNLIDATVIKAIARLPVLKDLEIEGRLRSCIVTSIITSTHPFANLLSLTLWADAAVSEVVLPHLKKLERLHMTVCGTSSIFPSVRLLENLTSLQLNFESYELSDADMTDLRALTKLETLVLREAVIAQEAPDATSLDVSVLLSVLGSLPALTSLEIYATNHFGDPFLVGLGRGCPRLQSLLLAGSFPLEALMTEPATLFPHLETLRLGGVTPALTRGRGRWARRCARYLSRHAPNLEAFYSDIDGDETLGIMIEEAWWDLER